ncbi:acyl-CoA thioesterase, partial [Mycobacterium sp. ITM-2017-0098]
APVRWRDAVRVGAECTRVGSTSFTIGFTVSARTGTADERVAVRGHNVYVVVSTEDWAKRPVPDALRHALVGR